MLVGGANPRCAQMQQLEFLMSLDEFIAIRRFPRAAAQAVAIGEAVYAPEAVGWNQESK